MHNFSEEELIQAIKGSGGIISTIAKRLGCWWDAANKAIFNNEAAIIAYNNEKESLLDISESVIINDINLNKNVGSAKWYMLMQGRRRGYVEKQEITGNISTNNKTELSIIGINVNSTDTAKDITSDTKDKA